MPNDSGATICKHQEFEWSPVYRILADIFNPKYTKNFTELFIIIPKAKAFKLYSVAPFYNRASTKQLHHFVWQN